MSRVRLQGASFQFTDATAILERVDLVLTTGWTGLVGPNGAGKSTLLRLVDGTLTPTAGLVRRDPEGLRVTSCPQEVLELALAEYPGALLLVTHDDEFARACTKQRWWVGRSGVEMSS